MDGVASSIASSVASGACVGWSETLVGYPFVTCKVLLQNGASCWGHPLRRYYRGVKYPLMSSVGFNMVVFPLHEFLCADTGHVVGGALSGLAISPAVYFFDKRMVRCQVGGRSALSRGFGMTCCREVLAMSAYFGVYYRAREDYGSLVSGGAAGLANWTLTYPLDTLRNRQIAQGCSVRAALKQGRLWRGYSFAASRSVVVNAVSFTLWEFLRYK